jgi:hypothetical protein
MRALQAGRLLAILLATIPLESRAQPGRGEPRIAATFELPRAVRAGEELVLTPIGGAARLRIEPGEETRMLRALPLTMDLLPMGEANAFGTEERCRMVRTGDGIDIACDPGTAPAGVLVRFAARYPKGARVEGQIAASGGEGFTAQLVTVGKDAFRATAVGGASPLRVPLDTGEAAQLVVLAPAGGGRLKISRLSVEPLAQVSGITAGGWAWEPDLWLRRGGALIRAAAARRFDRLYITLSIEEGRVRHRSDLIRFIRAARAQGIAVEAVEGDPDMVTVQGLRSAVERARAIAAFERDAPADARLAAVQYDIEPYTLAGWGAHPADYRGWAQAVRALAQAAGRPVHLVLPFWIADDAGGAQLLRGVAGSVSGVTAMAYRSEPAEIAAIAEPLLAWGVAAGKKVRIALEAGPVAAESEERFRPAASGRLAVLQVGGEGRALLLAGEGRIEGAQMFASAGRASVEPGRISFLGNEAEMVRAAGRLRAAFGAWSSFEGLSYHGIDWLAGTAAVAAAAP